LAFTVASSSAWCSTAAESLAVADGSGTSATGVGAGVDANNDDGGEGEGIPGGAGGGTGTRGEGIALALDADAEDSSNDGAVAKTSEKGWGTTHVGEAETTKRWEEEMSERGGAQANIIYTRYNPE
jgi:hypothetical protein